MDGVNQTAGSAVWFFHCALRVSVVFFLPISASPILRIPPLPALAQKRSLTSRPRRYNGRIDGRAHREGWTPYPPDLRTLRTGTSEVTAMDTNPTKNAQIVYFSHGGGPLPILGDPSHQAMVDFMRAAAGAAAAGRTPSWSSARTGRRARPRCWARRRRRCSTTTTASPRQAYEITYPAPGQPRRSPSGSPGCCSENGIPAAHRPAARASTTACSSR